LSPGSAGWLIAPAACTARAAELGKVLRDLLASGTGTGVANRARTRSPCSAQKAVDAMSGMGSSLQAGNSMMVAAFRAALIH
jgi:hypothetical protein